MQLAAVVSTSHAQGGTSDMHASLCECESDVQAEHLPAVTHTHTNTHKIHCNLLKFGGGGGGGGGGEKKKKKQIEKKRGEGGGGGGGGGERERRKSD